MVSQASCTQSGASQLSSSTKPTTSCVAVSRARSRAWPMPRRGSVTTRSGAGAGSGQAARATAAVSSVEALSTTTTSHGSVGATRWAARWASVGRRRLAQITQAANW